jgi:nucleotide-binding universal stress UspA family protein
MVLSETGQQETEMIKDIVVHLTGSDEDRVRLAYAEPTARAFGANLTGLQVHVLPELVMITDPTGSAFLQELLAQSYEAAKPLTDALRERFSRLEVPNDVRRIDVYPSTAGAELARETRTADLFIGTRPYGDPTGDVRAEEGVLFQSGRACLFVPPHGTPPEQYATVFVAWKDTREAARAVAEALPFLERARQVVVGLVEEEGASEQFQVAAGGDIGRYLSRHSISVEIRLIAGWADTAEALINEATQVGADMIVMGGYGHSRFREWVLGGVTRDVLSRATVPVLMAH